MKEARAGIEYDVIHISRMSGLLSHKVVAFRQTIPFFLRPRKRWLSY